MVGEVRYLSSRLGEERRQALQARQASCFYSPEGEWTMSAETCEDNRFLVIERAKKDLFESTNIEMVPKEVEVIDSILFRCWQMGWLKEYE